MAIRRAASLRDHLCLPRLGVVVAGVDRGTRS
jgi:hypothetical protein